jgi:hypothetical protein
MRKSQPERPLVIQKGNYEEHYVVWAKFILSPKTCDNVDNKKLFLLSTLVFMYPGVIRSGFIII